MDAPLLRGPRGSRPRRARQRLRRAHARGGRRGRDRARRRPKKVVALTLTRCHAEARKARDREFLDALRPPDAVEPLIVALGADTLEVRQRAHALLQRITEASRRLPRRRAKGDRDAAVERWRAWWAQRAASCRRGGARASRRHVGVRRADAGADGARLQVEGPRHRAALRLDGLDGGTHPRREGAGRRDRRRAPDAAAEPARLGLHLPRPRRRLPLLRHAADGRRVEAVGVPPERGPRAGRRPPRGGVRGRDERDAALALAARTPTRS